MKDIVKIFIDQKKLVPLLVTVLFIFVVVLKISH